MTKHFALFGHPVAHSFSPAMQRAAFYAAGVDATYELVDVAPGSLETQMRALRDGAYDGANVTAPYKASVLAYVDEVDLEGTLLGAVNTLVRVGHGVFATNTDAHGLVRALDEEGVSREIEKVVVLGAGGAARAAVLAALRRGAKRVEVLARREAAAESLVSHFRRAAGDAVLAARPFPEGLEGAFDGAGLVIQATTATSGDHAAEFVGALPLERLPKDAFVLDLVYAPSSTRLLVHAEARALRTANGLGMLLHQGALAFERWTGKDAPLEAMRHALELAVKERR